jgi:RNA polymerase sigma factor (sigma-70 family)
MRRLQETGDMSALDELYGAHGQAVEIVVLAVLRGEHETVIGDVCQEVWFKLMRKPSVYRITGVPFVGWLRQVTRRFCLMYCRARKSNVGHAESLAQDFDLPGGEPLATDLLDAPVVHKKVLAAMAALPKAQREAFFMYAVEGKTAQEIADAIGESDNRKKVEGRINLARRKLKNILEEGER